MYVIVLLSLYKPLCRKLSKVLEVKPFLARQNVDEEGTTLLHLAANCSNSGYILELLVGAGAQLNAQDGDGYTPLHVASINGCTEGLRSLLLLGADPFILDNELMTAYEVAEENGQLECMTLLHGHLKDSKQSKNSVIHKQNESIDTDLDQSICQAFVSMTTKSCEEYKQKSSGKTNSYTTVPPDINRQSDRNADTDADIDEEEDTTNDNPLLIPDEVSCLSNEQLRSKLKSLGEKPGPVTDSTRPAYQVFLTKVLSGVQPAGNTGYKGTCVCMKVYKYLCNESLL